MDATRAGLQLDAVLLLGLPDREWGERLVALVRWSSADVPSEGSDALRRLVSGWPAAERPLHWYLCPILERSSAGKWERARWRTWLLRQRSAQPH